MGIVLKGFESSLNRYVAIMIGWARGVLLDWKVCRSPYEKYGGRVGIGRLGAWTAFDGLARLVSIGHRHRWHGARCAIRLGFLRSVNF